MVETWHELPEARQDALELETKRDPSNHISGPHSASPRMSDWKFKLLVLNEKFKRNTHRVFSPRVV